MARDRAPAGAEVHELVLDGERYLVLSHAISGEDQLTRAEREVLALLDRGRSDREIAAKRKTSRGTVTKQIDAVFRKLGVSSRRELLTRPR